jgi:hypothetical protein
MTATGKLGFEVFSKSRLNQVRRCLFLNLNEGHQYMIAREGSFILFHNILICCLNSNQKQTIVIRGLVIGLLNLLNQMAKYMKTTPLTSLLTLSFTIILQQIITAAVDPMP